MAAVGAIAKCRRSTAFKALTVLKRLMGNRVDVDAADCLALNATKVAEAPFYKKDGSKYDLHEITPTLVKQAVCRHVMKNGERTKYRFYLKGAQHEREKKVMRSVNMWVKDLQAAKEQLLYEIRGCRFGEGLFNLRHSDKGHTLTTSTGEPLQPRFSCIQHASGKEIVHRGARTQSQVDVHGAGIHQGRLVHLALCGTPQYVNHACSECATHDEINWGHGKDGCFVQRWLQLLPGVEITLNYGYEDEDANHPCSGPFCRPEKWCHVLPGSLIKCNGREVVVRDLKPGEDQSYAGAFAPRVVGHTPMEEWLAE